MSTSQKHTIPWGALGPWLALAVTCLFFTTQSDRFLSGGNLSLVLQQVMVVGVLAIGQSLIILTAGIDLSCGMVMALGGIVMTKLAVGAGMNAYLAIVCGLLACMAFGLLNGLLVTRIKLPPFIVTLGTLYIFQALKLWYSQSESIRNVDTEATAPLLIWFGKVISIGGFQILYGTIAFLLLAWLWPVVLPVTVVSFAAALIWVLASTLEHWGQG